MKIEREALLMLAIRSGFTLTRRNNVLLVRPMEAVTDDWLALFQSHQAALVSIVPDEFSMIRGENYDLFMEYLPRNSGTFKPKKNQKPMETLQPESQLTPPENENHRMSELAEA
jgi:hypothetical protein